MERITIHTPIQVGDKIMINNNGYLVKESNYEINNSYFNIDLAVYTLINLTTNEEFHRFHNTLINDQAYKL